MTVDRADSSCEALKTGSGNNVKMATSFPERVKKALQMGTITRADLEHCARRVLELVMKID